MTQPSDQRTPIDARPVDADVRRETEVPPPWVKKILDVEQVLLAIGRADLALKLQSARMEMPPH